MNCIACGSAHPRQIDAVAVDSLSEAYLDPALGIDTRRLFAGGESALRLMHCAACDLRWYAPIVSGDADFYAGLQRHDWYYQEYKPEYDHAKQSLKAGMSVLEVGCGAGAFAAFMPQGAQYRGLEFNAEAVARARAKGLDVEIRPVEAEAADKPGHYDLVCNFQVLEHVEDPAGFLASCVAALKPGGLLVVATPAEDSFLSAADAVWLNMPPHHLTRWSDRALTNAFKRAGVEAVDIWHEQVADFHAQWYRSVMAMYGLSTLLGLKSDALVRPPFLKALVRKLQRIPALGPALVRRGEARFPFAGRGHTVCAVGIKRAESS